MYSFSTGNLPPKFDPFFCVNNSIHSYNKRHASFFLATSLRDKHKAVFYYPFKALDFFDTLSSEIKTTPTLISFKHKLKDFLINDY